MLLKVIGSTTRQATLIAVSAQRVFTFIKSTKELRNTFG